jgi:hypothetical protein
MVWSYRGAYDSLVRIERIGLSAEIRVEVPQKEGPPSVKHHLFERGQLKKLLECIRSTGFLVSYPASEPSERKRTRAMQQARTLPDKEISMITSAIVSSVGGDDTQVDYVQPHHWQWWPMYESKMKRLDFRPEKNSFQLGADLIHREDIVKYLINLGSNK